MILMRVCVCIFMKLRMSVCTENVVRRRKIVYEMLYSLAGLNETVDARQ